MFVLMFVRALERVCARGCACLRVVCVLEALALDCTRLNAHGAHLVDSLEANAARGPEDGDGLCSQRQRTARSSRAARRSAHGRILACHYGATESSTTRALGGSRAQRPAQRTAWSRAAGRAAPKRPRHPLAVPPARPRQALQAVRCLLRLAKARTSISSKDRRDASSTSRLVMFS